MLDQRFTRGCTFVDWNMLKSVGMVAHITLNAVDTSAASWVVKPMFGYQWKIKRTLLQAAFWLQRRVSPSQPGPHDSISITYLVAAPTGVHIVAG